VEIMFSILLFFPGLFDFLKMNIRVTDGGKWERRLSKNSRKNTLVLRAWIAQSI
jgi:hypothetical protein